MPAPTGAPPPEVKLLPLQPDPGPAEAADPGSPPRAGARLHAAEDSLEEEEGTASSLSSRLRPLAASASAAAAKAAGAESRAAQAAGDLRRKAATRLRRVAEAHCGALAAMRAGGVGAVQLAATPHARPGCGPVGPPPGGALPSAALFLPPASLRLPGEAGTAPPWRDRRRLGKKAEPPELPPVPELEAAPEPDTNAEAKKNTKEGCHAAYGTGAEVLLQAFNWESPAAAGDGRSHWAVIADEAVHLAAAGFSAVWLPPPSDAVDRNGYLPRDLMCFDSHFGTEAELRAAVGALRRHGVKPIADAVVNHRCATAHVSRGRLRGLRLGLRGGGRLGLGGLPEGPGVLGDDLLGGLLELRGHVNKGVGLHDRGVAAPAARHVRPDLAPERPQHDAAVARVGTRPRRLGHRRGLPG